MQKLNQLYSKLYEDDIYFFDYRIHGEEKAAVIESNNNYGIFVDYTKIDSFSDELSILAHEYGHIKTGATHRTYSPLELVAKNEYRANKYAVKMLIPISKLKSAFLHGVCETWELAEHFEVTEDFIHTALYIYHCMGLLPI